MRAVGEFQKVNPNPKTELNFFDSFSLLVAVVLSAQATDKVVNKVTEKLFQVYKTPKDFASLKEDDLFVYTKFISYYRVKSRNIIALSKILIEKHSAQVPMSFEDLINLPGVGRKTANVILSNLVNAPVIAVDTHVHRVANRIGLVKTKQPEKTEFALMSLLKKEKKEEIAGNLHNWLVLHGRYICKARKPECKSCSLESFCGKNIKIE
jgi:endonuclease-3